MGVKPADSISERMRNYMMNGEWFTSARVTEIFGGSHGLPTLVRRQLEDNGYRFKVENVSKGGGIKRWKCTNPEKGSTRSYTSEEVEARRAEAATKVSAAMERAEHVKAAAQNGHTTALLADPGPSMLGIPLESQIRPEADTDGMVGTALPFAGKVQVFAMILKEDGTLRFGIQSDDTRWFADVVGEIKR